ncbi:hypothetical protein [Arthrobacter sp. ISL-28]|uniref:hypothetical protein n=1 Tax=Arthrobacter sp. ISL-28 TaxID=2819108 RepID=UPI00203592E4|nr:hypothetical protein [Arthrobacter sp. ISL-28]
MAPWSHRGPTSRSPSAPRVHYGTDIWAADGACAASVSVTAGTSVDACSGSFARSCVTFRAGTGTGAELGATLGEGVGVGVGAELGAALGEGIGVGTGLGAALGEGVGVGTGLGAALGEGIGAGAAVRAGEGVRAGTGAVARAVAGAERLVRETMRAGDSCSSSATSWLWSCPTGTAQTGASFCLPAFR